MTTPTPEQHAAIAAIHQRAANDHPSSGWTDVAVLTAMEYAEGYRETVRLQREEIAELKRERDEAKAANSQAQEKSNCNGSAMASFAASGGSASRSYWLYVWRGSKYRIGHPVEYSEPPQRFTAICDEEAAEIAAERADDAVIWELHDGSAEDANTKQIASKHRPLVMPNDTLCREAGQKDAR